MAERTNPLITSPLTWLLVADVANPERHGLSYKHLIYTMSANLSLHAQKAVPKNVAVIRN